MPYCSECGSEYKEGTSFCNSCGNELPKGKTVAKQPVKITPKPKEIQKTKEFSSAKLIKGAGAILLVLFIIFVVPSIIEQSKKDQQATDETLGTLSGKLSPEQQRVLDRYNDYVKMINNDVDKTNGIRDNYPDEMTNDQYIDYVNEYIVEGTYFKQHLLEYRAFVDANDEILTKSGVNPIETKTFIDNNLAIIDKNAKSMQTNIQQIQQREEMKVNLLKGLAGLFL